MQKSKIGKNTLKLRRQKYIETDETVIFLSEAIEICPAEAVEICLAKQVEIHQN